MDRRTFVKSAAVATITSSMAAQPAGKKPRKNPNILFVFGDQHRADSLPGEPFNEAIAPNFESFRRTNFSMDRCISNYPLCTPYRGILMSGKWPHQTGVIFNNIPLAPSDELLGHTFSAAGYHTGYIGKWHLAGGEASGFIPKGPRRLGFEHWQIWDATNNHFHSWTFDQETGQKITPQGWQPTCMTDEAVQFLKAQSNDKPWFLALSWNPPHPPFDPPAEDAAPYAGALKRRPNVKLRPGIKGMGEARALESDAQLHEAMQGYYGGITGIDKEFGRLLKTLEETGQADNTIVIYTSDHGEMLASHGRMAKQVPFEESVRVPFMIRFPGASAHRGSSNALFSAMDMYPTLCGLAGIPVPAHCAGKDLSPVLRGGKGPDAEHVFLLNQVDEDGLPEHGPGGPKNHGGTLHFVNEPTYRGIRTKTHTYAVADSGRWILYDNVADPYQLKNLVSEPAQQGLVTKLDALIAEWIKSTGDTFPYAETIKKTSSVSAS